MPDVTPDPVPPPGKPRIGVAWLAVAAAIAILFAIWLYFSTKDVGPEGPRASAAESQAT